MKEVEIKVLDINKDEIVGKLEVLGAVKKWSGLVVEKQFDFPDRSLNKVGKTFRLRTAYDVTELTLKLKREDSMFAVREEIEVSLDKQEFDETERIIVNLGLENVRHREKFRTSYFLDDTKFEIDEYPGFPGYMEIEGSEDKIMFFVDKLGLQKDKLCNLSSTQLLKNAGLNHDFLFFDK